MCVCVCFSRWLFWPFFGSLCPLKVHPKIITYVPHRTTTMTKTTTTTTRRRHSMHTAHIYSGSAGPEEPYHLMLYTNINFLRHSLCMHAKCKLVNLCSLWLLLQYLSSLTSRKLHAFPTCSFSKADHEKQCELCKLQNFSKLHTVGLLCSPIAIPLQIYFLRAWHTTQKQLCGRWMRTKVP